MNKATVEYAFCQGKGVDPFEIMSQLSTCYVCGGKTEVTVEEPYVTCAYCKGTGVHPGTRMDCLVCRGRGVVHIEEPVEKCPDCGGTRVEKLGFMPCLTCKGKGVVSVKKKGGNEKWH